MVDVDWYRDHADWYEDHDGQSIVLSTEKVAAEFDRLLTENKALHVDLVLCRLALQGILRLTGDHDLTDAWKIARVALNIHEGVEK
jgi:hypothetical protein